MQSKVPFAVIANLVVDEQLAAVLNPFFQEHYGITLFPVDLEVERAYVAPTTGRSAVMFSAVNKKHWPFDGEYQYLLFPADQPVAMAEELQQKLVAAGFDATWADVHTLHPLSPEGDSFFVRIKSGVPIGFRLTFISPARYAAFTGQTLPIA